MNSNISIVLIYDEEYGGYVADVPQLPGCMSQGKTREEVLSNIHEAVELYVETLTTEEKNSLLETRPVGFEIMQYEFAV